MDLDMVKFPFIEKKRNFKGSIPSDSYQTPFSGKEKKIYHGQKMAGRDKAVSTCWDN
ncbi:hypothetical protein [Ruthenibacterium lactatiformans]|uniref:hypothetical protein n=1 Tax=Ruthenibacterium lactatiformans TaxID=1550024 RepID=UPI001325F43B|nr:hypothetical protein [Ruthenibacterium lactatiformans]MTQ79134.1 hypothetical protein [Ruthenibacterium lactatiformans]MTS29598.1 hypothetical protein [Ruthenibacterium lactatiformans]MTS36683.1 hypothetical protein [Ruthenibacterium lactatiformans]MTS40447.1 hypothetical protein [Ruthenibacterium lactatiformans]MTS66423.1 hypothetical protein [Ruthenibacterium lactatiformans]